MFIQPVRPIWSCLLAFVSYYPSYKFPRYGHITLRPTSQVRLLALPYWQLIMSDDCYLCLLLFRGCSYFIWMQQRLLFDSSSSSFFSISTQNCTQSNWEKKNHMICILAHWKWILADTWLFLAIMFKLHLNRAPVISCQNSPKVTRLTKEKSHNLHIDTNVG